MAKKVTRWTRCSREDLQNYVNKNGGKQFCIYAHTKFARVDKYSLLNYGQGKYNGYTTYI